jgi:hypothetical protein
MLEKVADNVLHHFGIQPSLGSPSESAVTRPVKITEACRLPTPKQIVYGRVLPRVAKLRGDFDGRGRNPDGCKLCSSLAPLSTATLQRLQVELVRFFESALGFAVQCHINSGTHLNLASPTVAPTLLVHTT